VSSDVTAGGRRGGRRPRPTGQLLSLSLSGSGQEQRRSARPLAELSGDHIGGALQEGSVIPLLAVDKRVRKTNPKGTFHGVGG
jgi:hypothetical protein